MKSFLTPILTALAVVSTAAVNDANRKLAKPEDLQKIVDASRVDLSRKTQMEPDACVLAEEAMYNGTAIESAGYLTFIFSYVWTDPTFDMKAFFDDLDFDAQCSSFGGTVYQPEIELQCPTGTSSWTEFKFCKPAVCDDDFMYTLGRSGLIEALAPYTGCDMSLIDDTVPSLACVMGLNEIYSNVTAPLAAFAPELSLSEEGIQTIEELGSCTNLGSQGFDIGVCQMTDLKEEYTLITNLCEGLYDAKIEPWDMTLSVPFYHRTLRRYPVCTPDVCSTNDLLLYYGYIATLYEGGAKAYYPGISIDINFYPSVVNTCDETPKEMAFMKSYNDKVVIKSCRWLKKRKEFVKNRYCKKDSGHSGFEPANVVCPSTCCVCEEKDDDVFLKKMIRKETGEVKLQKQTCSWLKSSSADVIEWHCGKKAASFVGGLPPAAAACPQVCGCSE